ncbi:OprD family porin [Stutzerimonas urumqiensis]|uniref:OprD family porin n=1 Tax=Stutzerimonas urumqiensis TaxID=638269 RepID=UPI000EAC263E|nr:OprD family porin [Stutzerimonas urumqiensis]
MQVMKWSVIALAVAAGTTQMAVASQQSESNGFVDDSKLNILTRSLYMNRDFRGDAGQSYREAWGLGFIGTYESGFTQGTVGVGVDAIGLLGVKLDSGRGRAGNGLFPRDSEGRPQDDYSEAGAAIKFRVSNSVLKVGDQFVALPVFSTDDSRLLPETAEGGLITSSEIENLELNVGYFTGLNAQAETNHDSVGLDSLALIGGTYGISDNLSTSLYYSDVEDAFQKYYGNLNYAVPLAESQSLAFDFNIYQSEYEQEFTNTGSEEDNTIWSLSGAYSFDAHTVTLAYQQSHGGFDGLGYYYGVDGGGTVWLANSVQYSDFNGEDEKSWQVRYDLNMASYGVPGLSFMTRYLTGYDISTPTGEGEEREWDVEAKYVVQEGPAKDLSLRLRHAKYWSDSDYEPINGNDLTDVRLIVQYPLSIM